MGVKGLWKLLDGTGRPINLESLEGKTLAVDISVWLNMAIKGMRDYQGHSSQTAHLTSLFNRICKLLYYGVKPVFVFDGQAPALKQKTLRERRERKNFNIRESRKASEKILQNYLKKRILQETVSKSKPDEKPGTSEVPDETTSQGKPTKVKSQEKDIYDLPPLASQLEDSDQEGLEEELKMRAELQTEYLDDAGHVDIASILNMNIDSKDFDSLPSDVQYELLKDLKEIRKRRRTKLEAMPEESNCFSDYQIAGLLAKRKISKKMEFVENKMSEENLAASSQLSGLGTDDMKDHVVDAQQLVSDSSTHYIWMRKLSGKEEKKPDEDKSIEKESPPLSAIVEETEPSLEEKLLSSVRDQPSPVLPGNTAQNVVQPSALNESHLSPGKFKTKEICRSQTSQEVTITDSLNAVENVTTSSGTIPNADHSFREATQLEGSKDNMELPKHSSTSGSNTALAPSSNITDKRSLFHETTETIVVEDQDSSGDNVRNQHQAVHPDEVIPEKRFTENDVVKQIEPSTAQEISTVSVTKESPVIEIPEEEGSETSDEEFMDVPEQDYSNIPLKEATPPRDYEISEQNVKTAEKKSDEEYNEDNVNPWDGLDVENVENFTSQLDTESKELQRMMQAKELAAKDLSQSAQLECQELLKLFGLPYIVSPQEAEAQCATLELLGLTQGTITEDSDIWLFGGKYVIKDMFGSKSDPVAFNVSDIEMQLGLNRDRFICIALCSGSDYTTGIRGIGPVTAMEILKEFEGEGIQGLVKLKDWWTQVTSSTKQAIPTETKIKSQLRKINLRKDFPSETVYKAYLQPVVDDQNKKFEWGFPDLDELRHFATGTMSWTRQKVDEILLPVMKKLGKQRSLQTRITQFVSPVPRSTGKKRSKRVMRAAAVLTGTGNSYEHTDRKKKRPRKAVSETKKAEAKKEVKLNLSESSSDEG